MDNHFPDGSGYDLVSGCAQVRTILSVEQGCRYSRGQERAARVHNLEPTGPQELKSPRVVVGLEWETVLI